jgi:hypothetical protein
VANIWEETDDGEEAAALLRRLYPLIVERAWDDAVRAGVPAGAFDLANPLVQELIGQLASQVTRIAETTRDEIRALVALQAEQGWGADELARELRLLADIRSATRAATIARTETGTAYNLGAVAAYRAGGVTHVDVLDGDEHEPCASANGARWTIEEAQQNPLGHPNCTRAFSPVVEA